MAIIELANSDFESKSENVSRTKLSNMYIVNNPLSLSGYSYVPRPSLTQIIDIPNVIIRGIWFQGSRGQTTIYVVGDETLYVLVENSEAIPIGTIMGTGPCTFASTIYGIGIVADGVFYIYDNVSITPVNIPDGQQVTDVTSLDNYFILSIKNSNKFYWILPGEATIDPLSFASAERNPDDIVALSSIGDELWLLGQNTAEVYSDTGDSNAPFARISGRAYEVGCVDRLSVVRSLKNTLPCLIWVTPTKEVVLSQGVPSKISNEAIEELLKASSSFRAWSFTTNRHDFYVLKTENVTVVYDLTVDKWYRWSSYELPYWVAAFGIQVNDTIFATTDTNGKIFTLGYDHTDSGNDFLVCEVGGFIPNSSANPVACNWITLFLSYGTSDSYVVAPLIELRWSDDGGKTWSAYMQGRTGSKGLYDTDITFRSLGHITKPGRQIEIRFSEVQTLRLDGATLNA